MTNSPSSFERDYDREAFRSELYTALWAAFEHKKSAGMSLTKLSEILDKDKGYLSRLFSTRANCKLDTVSDIAHALNMKPSIEFVDQISGARYTAAGVAVQKEYPHARVWEMSFSDESEACEEYQYEVNYVTVGR